MNIYALEGHKVKCTNLNAGWPTEGEHASEFIKEGETYTVDRTIADNWSTEVILKEFPKQRFNSVFFEDVEPQSEEDDKKHYQYHYYN